MTAARPSLVHVIHLDGPGGGPQSLITQLRMLAPHYAQFVLHGGSGRVAAFCEQEGIPHRQVAIDTQHALFRGGWQCYRFLKTIKPDVLVLHGQWAGPVGALAGWLAGIRHRVYIARWPAFYANWDLLRSLRNHLAERVPCALSHRVVCLTDSSRYQYLLRRLADPSKLRVVPNALVSSTLLDTERISRLRAEHGFDRFTCNVVSVGRLVQQKRGDWLLESWKRVIQSKPHAHLWIVGQGDRRDDLRKLAHRLDLDQQVTWIEDERYTGAEFIAAGDILAHTALFETFGNVVLEAFVAKTPIVATEVDGPRSIITHERDGLLIPPGDTEAFANALLQLIEHPEKRARLVEAGIQTAAHYHPDRVLPALLAALAPDSRPLMTHVVHHDGPGGGPPIVVSLMRDLAAMCRQSAVCGGRGLIARHCERQGHSYSAIQLTKRRLWPLAGLPLWRKLRRMRTDILVVHGQPAAPVAALIGRLAGIRRLIYVAQWPAFYTDWDLFRLFRNRLSEWIPCRLADAIVTFTPSSRHQYLLRKLAAPDKIVCIPPALQKDAVPDADRLAAVRQRHGWRDSERHVVSVGRLADQKDMDQLLEAWSEVRRAVPNARLWIVGDGEEGPRLKQRALDLGLGDTCQFLGYRNDARAYIGAADVLVITSMYESFGYVALEACACGTPVVASRVDGLMDVFSDGVEGYQVPPHDSAAMAERLIELLNRPDRRAEMGRQGRLRAAYFSPDHIRRLWFDLLNQRLGLIVQGNQYENLAP